MFACKGSSSDKQAPKQKQEAHQQYSVSGIRQISGVVLKKGDRASTSYRWMRPESFLLLLAEKMLALKA